MAGWLSIDMRFGCYELTCGIWCGNMDVA